jgi:hypothetical protein
MVNLQSDLFDDAAERAVLAGKASHQRRARSGTFTDNMRLPVHGWFRYSAGFSAEWATEEIKARLKSGQSVLDPFAGAGTTLLASQAANVASFGFESHPFVYRIARAKLQWQLDANHFRDVARKILDCAKRRKTTATAPPALLINCFHPDVLQRLDALRIAYLELRTENDPTWELIWLALTAILRVCSHVGTAQWQYVLPNRQKAKWADPYVAFNSLATAMAQDMKAMQAAGYSAEATLVLTDARAPTFPDAKKVELVVTSPPYPNNYDYADATRLEMTFWREIESWGDLQSAVRTSLIRSCSQHSAAEKLDLEHLLENPVVAPIGAELSAVCRTLAEVRLMKGGKKTYHTMIAAYFCDLAKVWISLRKICRSGAKVCFVIGDSAPYGVYVPAERWLGELAMAAGFHNFAFEKLRDRNIKWKNRKHRVPLHEGRLWVDG